MDKWNGCKYKAKQFYNLYIDHPTSKKLSLLKYDEDGQLDQGSIIPVIDGGTEGMLIRVYYYVHTVQCTCRPLTHPLLLLFTPPMESISTEHL